MSPLVALRVRALTTLGFAYCLYAYVSYAAHWIIPVCVFRLLTGLPCPLCGLTRSVGAALNGDWTGSFRFHILGLALVVAVVAAAVVVIAQKLRSMKRQSQLALYPGKIFG